MSHKYSAGQSVYFEAQFGNNAARGVYKIVCPQPIERDERLSYRINCRGAPTYSHGLIGLGVRYGDTCFALPNVAFGGKADIVIRS